MISILVTPCVFALAGCDNLEAMDLKWHLSLLIKGRVFQLNWSQDSSKRIVKVEDTSSKAILAIDGVGFDWSDKEEEQVQINMALMIFSDSKASTYKRGLATVEEQLVTFRKNEVLFGQEITVLKREVGCKDYELGLNEFKEPDFTGYGPRDTGLKSTIICDKESNNSEENTDDSLEKEQVSDNENSFVESSPNVAKETILHAAKKVEFVKPKNNEKLVKRSVSFNHVKINFPDQQRKRMVTGNNYNRVDYDYYAKTSHPNTHRNMTPRAVLLKSGLKPLSTARQGNPHLNDKGFVDSGSSRNMTGNIAYLSNFKEFDEGHVTFRGGAYGGRITGKDTLKTNSLDFDDVYFVKELKFNLFSVSRMCDKKNYVLFTNTECLFLSSNFKLPDVRNSDLMITKSYMQQ
ncbi:hypothetical protein Tco_1429450 [Tanacetum coccineum]